MERQKIMFIIIPIIALIEGNMYQASAVGVVMIFIEIIFSGSLFLEVKKMMIFSSIN